MNRKQTPSPQKKAQTKSSGRSEELEAFLPGYMGYAHSERSIQ